MKIRITQIDGNLPNLALMALSSFYKAEGHEVFFQKTVTRSMFEPDYDLVLGSAIFGSSTKKIKLFLHHFPSAVVGGTGSGRSITVEEFTENTEFTTKDYSIYPDFKHSIGFSQRGCRLRCKFCVVPEKEGKNRSVSTISDIWRGVDYPKNILLLDNDFFGQKGWEEKSHEIIDGGFKVSFSQGINLRLITKEGAALLSKMKYTDSKFKRKMIYTAWDNKRDERIFMKGVTDLLDVGIKPQNIMVYFLCNFWSKGLTKDIWYRFNQMISLGLKPYPMVFDKENASQDLKNFQRWVIRRNYFTVPFEEYNRSGRSRKGFSNQLKIIL
jgi:hypothetical protein